MRIFKKAIEKNNYNSIRDVVKKILKLVMNIIKNPLMFFYYIKKIKTYGIGYALAKIRLYFHKNKTGQSVAIKSIDIYKKFMVLPYFHNNYSYVKLSKSIQEKKIAVHLHLLSLKKIDYYIDKLRNINIPFSLYISVADIDISELFSIKNIFVTKLNHIEIIEVELVENRGRDIAPLIVTFGNELLKYDFICHIYTQKTLHHKIDHDYRDEIIESLIGSESIVNQNLNLLNSNASLICNEPQNSVFLYNGGWNGNYCIAKDLLDRFSEIKIENYPDVFFSQSSMFWARGKSLNGYLNLPINYADFPLEPIPVDGTIIHALERLIVLFILQKSERTYCIFSKNYIDGSGYYVDQKDFSNIPARNEHLKVLSYYLPQFHPTPENDKWHGKGFTEWTKVSACSPLFYEHYQQRVPHESLGYYHLDSPKVLKKQAEMMKKAKVYGQIFYHYWFSGKLILEKPAKMLLENKDIDMPFCFCWANENWTKKWDGNESEVLLEQIYSENDAREFINYLIPFFLDARYIKVNNRPVLFIYRPSSFPDFQLYKDIWNSVCFDNGLESLYLISTLTRGAISPNDYAMDAAVERVLHDWTDGNCPEKKYDITFFDAFKGRILDYSDVADYYMSLDINKDFKLFRSIVPMWDNTPRYNSASYIVHKSTPRIFEKWLEKIIEYTEKSFVPEEQFVVVNAWNEWAESAYLEPDKKNGYAYLNSIGRALTNHTLSYKEMFSGEDRSIPENISIYLNITFDLSTATIDNKEKFIDSVCKSSIMDKYKVYVSDKEMYTILKSDRNLEVYQYSSDFEADYTFLIADIVVFSDDLFVKMLKMVLRHPQACILANLIYNKKQQCVYFNDSYSISNYLAENYPVKLFSNKGFEYFKVRADAFVYLLDSNDILHKSKQVVSTVIRFHVDGNDKLLENALFSLYTQSACIVQPILMLQDCDEDRENIIKSILSKINWEYSPQIYKYYSSGLVKDMRSVMLNEGLKKAKNRYLAFLDYDDFLYPFAYSWLLGRLNETSKAVAYGNVFSAEYNVITDNVEDRKEIYNYGSDYKNFLVNNHSPLHSFMIDLSQVDVNLISYHEDQKYMEDYFLMLQVVTEDNTDWDSLAYEKYIGDYMHYKNSNYNTLAIGNPETLLCSEEYLKCAAYVNELILSIRKK